MEFRRIFKNAAFLYFRMILLIIISLYTSRVLLECLGVEDLGIFNVVGSVIILFDVVSSSLTNVAQRYLNIGLGKDDIVLTNKYFSKSVIIIFVMSLLIIFLLETIGLYIVYNTLDIPFEREFTAVVVYHISVGTVFFRINQIPYQGVIIARERLGIYAYLSIFEACSKLLIVYALLNNYKYDGLIVYAALLFLVQVLVFLIHLFYCRNKFVESKFMFFWDKDLFRDMLSFIGFNSIGYTLWALGNQGINILLNVFFGPAINGAKSLASTVERLVNQVVNSVFQAINPQITKSFASGNIDKMLLISEKSTLYLYYLILIVATPVFFNASFLLNIWLKEVPLYTEAFVKLMIIQSIFWLLPIPFNQIANSLGKIKNIQMYGRLFTLSSLPISYFLLQSFNSPLVPNIILILVSVFYWLYIAYDVSNNLNIDFNRYFKNVIIPICKVTFLFIPILAIISSTLMNTGFTRLSIVSASSIVVGVLVVFLLGVSSDDRKIIFLYLKSRK